jgi:hypothetical protein
MLVLKRPDGEIRYADRGQGHPILPAFLDRHPPKEARAKAA